MHEGRAFRYAAAMRVFAAGIGLALAVFPGACGIALISESVRVLQSASCAPGTPVTLASLSACHHHLCMQLEHWGHVKWQSECHELQALVF